MINYFDSGREGRGQVELSQETKHVWGVSYPIIIDMVAKMWPGIKEAPYWELLVFGEKF